MSQTKNDDINSKPCTLFDMDNCVSSFYTTWSFTAIILTLFFAIIMIPLFHNFEKLSSSVISSYIVFSIIIGFSINSIAVAVSSQILIGTSWKKFEKNKGDIINLKFVEKFTNENIKMHLIPVIISLLLLFLITNVPWSGKKIYLYITSCLVPIVFFFVWASKSIPDGKNHKTTILNKSKIIYDQPDLITKISLPLTVLLGTAFYIFVMRGLKKTNVKK
jgi:hypothetical protein